jgi:hypothetical protein
MAEGQPSRGSDLEVAQRSADRLALALEEVGFDVGRAFPTLGSGRYRHGSPGVELGRVTAAVADRLSMVLARAAQHGVTVPTDERGT